MARMFVDESDYADRPSPFTLNPKPLRIAFCITDLQYGGAEKILCQLAKGLDRRRWKPAVFCLSSPQPLESSLRRAGIPVHCISAHHRWDVTVIPKLATAIRLFDPHVLQTFLFHANFSGRLAGRWAGVPLIVSGARVAERRFRWPMILDNLTARLADHTICVSQGVARWTHERAHWPRSRLSVIPNGVDVSAFESALPADRNALGVPDDALVVLFVGRLDPQKGLHDLLEAFAGLRKEIPRAHLLMVGQGPLQGVLQSQSANLQLQDCIHFTDWRADVANLMKAADIFALPSHWEGMPNVLLEAMAAGLPVVATRVEGSEEAVIHGETGLLVSPGDPTMLKSALIELAKADQLRVKLSETARKRVREFFTIETMIARYERRYLELLGKSQ